MTKQVVSFLDTNLQKVISRKFLVFLIATTALFLKILDGDNWVIISGIYLGVQGWLDYLKNKGSNSEYLSGVK